MIRRYFRKFSLGIGDFAMQFIHPGGGLDPEAKWGIGIEGTYQERHGSDFEFYSYGSMVSFEL
jgi:hypothetical protein